MDTFDQELALYESMFDATVNNATNLHQINCFKESGGNLFIESGTFDGLKEKAHNFVNKIKDAIIAFFKKCKEAITKKIEEVKLKHTINMIKKSGIKASKKLKVSGSKVTEIAQKAYKNYVKAVADISKKAVAAKSTKDIKELEKKFYECSKKYDASTSLSKKDQIDFITFGEAMTKLESDNLIQMNNISVAVVEELGSKIDQVYDTLKREEKQMKKEFKESTEVESTAEVAVAKKSFLQSMISKVSSVSKNIGSTIVKHKKGIIAAIIGLRAVYVVGEVKGQRKGYKNGVYDGVSSGLVIGARDGIKQRNRERHA